MCVCVCVCERERERERERHREYYVAPAIKPNEHLRLALMRHQYAINVLCFLLTAGLGDHPLSHESSKCER